MKKKFKFLYKPITPNFCNGTNQIAHILVYMDTKIDRKTNTLT